MEKGRTVRILVILLADVLVTYAYFVMQNYLTDVWGLSFTQAAKILNIWGGAMLILPMFWLMGIELFGYFNMLVLSTIALSVGTVSVVTSLPPVLARFTGTCREYAPNCIESIHKNLFYTGIVLVSLGISGTSVCYEPFLNEQKEATEDGIEDPELEREVKERGRQIASRVTMLLVTLAGAIALPSIKPWTIRFGVPAICTVLGTFVFLSGSSLYEKSRNVMQSPVTDMLRVFVVSASKVFKTFPRDAKYCKQGDHIPDTFRRTRFLRCLEKAALDTNPDALERNKWEVCTVKEVEAAKITVRMIPMWMTFIICGTVSSIGNTYFVEQASKMDRRIGTWNVPTQILLLFSKFASGLLNAFADSFLCRTEKEPIPCSTQSKMIKIPRIGKRPAVGIGLAMIFSIVCCMTAASIEERRLRVIRRLNLLENPKDVIRMSVYWLLFQFFLLAGLDSFLRKSLNAFYGYKAPEPMKAYLMTFSKGVSGFGFIFSVFSVYVVGRISERGGRTNWFQFTLNKSRLDRYYWVLAGMSGVNLAVYVVVALFYRYKVYRTEDNELAEIEGLHEAVEDLHEGGCSCF